MTDRSIRCGLVSLCVTVALTAAAFAWAGGPVAVVRLTSLDEALADADRLARAFGQETSGDDFLRTLPLPPALSAIAEESLDRTRPLALVFPVEAVTVGTQATVAVVPVRDASAALAALVAADETAGETSEPDEAGVRRLTLHAMPLAVRPVGRYLVLGPDAGQVAGCDVKAATTAGDVPPGNLSVEIHVEPIAPMMQLGLLGARPAIAQQMARGLQGAQDRAAAESPGHGEHGPGHGHAHTEDPGAKGAPPSVPAEPSPDAVMPMIDLYIGALQDLLNNAARMALSFEVAGEHVLFHLRIAPRAGSTMAGLLAAQKGGLPALARLLDPGDPFVIGAGQITYTDAFRDALVEYTGRYAAAVEGLGSLAEGAGSAFLAQIGEMIRAGGTDWLDCCRGDFAFSMGLAGEGGFSMTQFVGAADADVCRRHTEQQLRALAGLGDPETGAGGFGITVHPNALEHGGVQATRMSLQLPSEGLAVEELRAVWGAGVIDTYYGITDGIVVTTSGGGAGKRFRSAVDRIRGGGKAPGAPVFAPLRVGPGFFAVYDFGALMQAMGDAAGEDGAGEFFAKLPPGGGTVTIGLRLGKTAADLDFALPMPMFQAATAEE